MITCPKGQTSPKGHTNLD